MIIMRFMDKRGPSVEGKKKSDSWIISKPIIMINKNKNGETTVFYNLT